MNMKMTTAKQSGEESAKGLFSKILIPVDGSRYGQYAADFAFLFAEKLLSQLAFQHVVDVRMADLLIEPEFAAELGVQRSSETTDQVMKTLHKTGRLILDLVQEEAKKRALKVETFRDEGYILYEVLRRAGTYDLIIIGHRGRGECRRPSALAIGSVAERVVLASHTPVLIASRSPAAMKQVMVGYDGSEPSIGALLMAEQLARMLSIPLKATYVCPSQETAAEAEYVIAQGSLYLREQWKEPVFSIDIGLTADVLLEQAASTESLLVMGAYGYRSADCVTTGTTATHVIRKAETNVLIYR